MKLALAGDTMLGRGVAERLAHAAPGSLFAPGVVEAAAEADLFVLNLECCISDRGEPWPDPGKPFFFRAPPVATEVLAHLGVDCVTLANNHALDFGRRALRDTFDHLAAAGISWVGAGVDEAAARRPAILERAGVRFGILGVADHPPDFAAGPHLSGVAFADLRDDVPEWLVAGVRSVDADIVMVTPHWGPNMVAAPVSHVRSAAARLAGVGATIVAGHSAHVFHGVRTSPGLIMFDVGDFVDDYAVDPILRNDLGLLFLVTIENHRPRRVEAVPLGLDFCFTRLADPDEHRWIADRFRRACAGFGTDVAERDGRLVIEHVAPG